MMRSGWKLKHSQSGQPLHFKELDHSLMIHLNHLSPERNDYKHPVLTFLPLINKLLAALVHPSVICVSDGMERKLRPQTLRGMKVASRQGVCCLRKPFFP